MSQAEIIPMGNRIAIKSPYNATLVAELKLIPGRQWDADKKVWTVPADQEGNARETVRKFFQIAGEASIVQMETVTLRVRAGATAKRTYLGGVGIDGVDLVNMGTGSLRMQGPGWEVLEATGGYLKGDARHAYRVEYVATLKLRKGATVEAYGRATVHGAVEVLA
jgi:hypothetical protein